MHSHSPILQHCEFAPSSVTIYIIQPNVMPCHLVLISLYPIMRTAILPLVVQGVLCSLSHGSPLFGAPLHNNAM